jgi:hypothetical protein
MHTLLNFDISEYIWLVYVMIFSPNLLMFNSRSSFIEIEMHRLLTSSMWQTNVSQMPESENL